MNKTVSVKENPEKKINWFPLMAPLIFGPMLLGLMMAEFSKDIWERMFGLTIFIGGILLAVYHPQAPWKDRRLSFGLSFLLEIFGAYILGGGLALQWTITENELGEWLIIMGLSMLVAGIILRKQKRYK